MEAYSKEFRGEVLAARDAGEKHRDVARRLAVSESWIRRIFQQRSESGQVAPKMTRVRTPKWRAWAEWLVARIEARPEIHLRERQAEYKTQRNEDASLETLSQACRALRLPRKKDADRRRTGSARRCRTTTHVDRLGIQSSLSIRIYLRLPTTAVADAQFF